MWAPASASPLSEPNRTRNALSYLAVEKRGSWHDDRRHVVQLSAHLRKRVAPAAGTGGREEGSVSSGTLSRERPGRPALELRGLSKHFGGVRALDAVDLTVLPGEVHGLLGENGSGKSTLIKVLAGFHIPDEGKLSVQGREIALPLHPGKFRELGLAFVHQDLGLIDSLSVLENLRIADFTGKKYRWRVRWTRERHLARELFARYRVSFDPSATVGELRPLQRATLAIMRAVEELRAEEERHHGAGLLILDEPTVFLPRSDVEQLFALVREIAGRGDSVLFVSHDLEQVREITDRVTVLRDGRNVGTCVTRHTDPGAIVELIIGRRLAGLDSYTHEIVTSDVCARVRGLTGGWVKDISFELARGEVVGVTGLAGSGFEDVPYLLFGARKAHTGRLEIGEDDLDLTQMTPHRALAHGLALVPGNRQRDGAVPSLPVVDNMSLPVLAEFGVGRGACLDRRAMRSRARALMAQYDVRPCRAEIDYGLLSGGNQQKALVAKWLQIKPNVLLLDEPTQGVDVGARQQIFGVILEAAAAGQAVLCASADYEQLGAICDRVLVVGGGKIARQLVGHEVTKERIAEQCYALVPAQLGGDG